MAKASNNKAAKAAPAKAAAKAAPAKAAGKAAPANAAKASPVSRGDVVDIVAAQSGLTRSQADSAIKAYESAIIRTLTDGGEVRLAGFGSFKTSYRAARTGRNPRTGGTVTVAARTVPRFSASSAFKTSVGGDAGGASKSGAAKGGASKGAVKGGAAKGAAKAPAKAAAKAAPAKGAAKAAKKK